MFSFYRIFSSSIRHFSTSNINVTNIAFDKIKDILKSTKNDMFLLSASSGGCNGFNYIFKPIKKKEFEDIKGKSKSIIIEKNNAKVAIDPVAELYLLGTNIDYVKEDYINGIYESGFKFTPNNDTSTSCGCGVSFGPK